APLRSGGFIVKRSRVRTTKTKKANATKRWHLLFELLTRIELVDAGIHLFYIDNPPKPSFDKEGFRGHEFAPHKQKSKRHQIGGICFLSC
ncbi:MAG: hypothetical protein II362_07470, partial [Alistipes sp.]|nr:hypothetical protein [Alistipes sp.]